MDRQAGKQDAPQQLLNPRGLKLATDTTNAPVEWVTVGIASKVLQVGASSLHKMKNSGELIAGHHFYYASGRKLLFAAERIRELQIEKSIAYGKRIKKLPKSETEIYSDLPAVVTGASR